MASYIYFERFLLLNWAKTDVNFMNKIKELVSSGKIDAAITLCENDNSPVSRLIQKNISYR